MSDATSRAGLVSGWITHHRASGVVVSRPVGTCIELASRSEYGALRLDPGQSATGEVFVVGLFDEALTGLEAYADAVAVANDVRLRPATAGYCTWYHAKSSDEKRMTELVKFVERTRLVDYGFEVMQIDDGWQRSRRDFSGQRGGGYGSGLDKMAATITGAGMQAGLWLIPFGWDHTSDVCADHPDWFVRRKGTDALYTVPWGGTCLDMTHPGARDLLHRSVRQICRTWGYKYIKIDGLWTGLAVGNAGTRYKDDGLGDAVFHDPLQTNVESYRRGLRLVREAAGADVYILGCNAAQNYRTLGASFGLVDGMRVGPDIGIKWHQILNAVAMGTRLYFLHNRVWHNDPDCLMVREQMTLDQARTWGGWIGLSGQLNIVSEWLPGLPEDRLDILRRSIPNHGLNARPVDLFTEKLARVWHVTDDRGPHRRDVVGLFNWGGGHKKLSVQLADIGLDPEARYHAFAYWRDCFIGPVTGTLALELAPAASGIVALVPADDVPRVVSTSRHVSQGMVDLADETWDAAALTLSATSKLVADDPYQLRLVFPPHRSVAGLAVQGGDQATIVLDQQNAENARITIRSAQTGALTWTVTFK